MMKHLLYMIVGVFILLLAYAYTLLALEYPYVFWPILFGGVSYVLGEAITTVLRGRT